MAVPAVGIAAVDLHEAHARLDQAPREQAARAELLRRRVVQPVKRARRRRFLREIHGVRRVRLHAERQFIGGDARGQFGVLRARRQGGAIEAIDEIDRGPLLFRAHARGRVQIQDR
jgi:hypothetical protein